MKPPMGDKLEMGRTEEDIVEDFLRCGVVDFTELKIYYLVTGEVEQVSPDSGAGESRVGEKF